MAHYELKKKIITRTETMQFSELLKTYFYLYDTGYIY